MLQPRIVQVVMCVSTNQNLINLTSLRHIQKCLHVACLENVLKTTFHQHFNPTVVYTLKLRYYSLTKSNHEPCLSPFPPTDLNAAPTVAANFVAVPGTALLLPDRRLQPSRPRPPHLPDDLRRDVPLPSPPTTADCLRLQAVSDAMNARTPSAASPAAPGPQARSARPSSPGESEPHKPASPMSPPDAVITSSVPSSGSTSSTYSKMAFHKASQVATNGAMVKSPSASSLLNQHAIPWKKRSIRPASINFHSIEDLVRPGDSYSSNSSDNRSHSPGGNAPGAAAYLLQDHRRVTPISLPYSRSSSSTLSHRLHLQEEPRRLPSPGSNNHSHRIPAVTCIDKANSGK